jgi:Mlc titration factor MtfA (ptsG expression regulator)
MEIILLFVGVAAFAAWAWGEPLWREWRLARLRRRPFPEAWRKLLQRRVPHVRRLPADLQLQLKGLIQVFLAEKAIIGCRGLVVDDEVRVTIAAQACLLLLNRTGRDTNRCYPNLRQVLVYPGAFLVDRVHTGAGGIVQDRRQALSGESWSQGQVILSWDDALDGAAGPDDGRNVVIHEFAHQLDQENGQANGAPPLATPADRERWAAVMAWEFDRLRRRLDDGETPLLNAYGATDPAEFFAVASEVFFEQPHELASEHAALYRELSRFYRVDPVQW